MIGIKDFGMPSCCVNCQMCDAYEQGTCVITDTECEDMYSQRNDDCPLVEMTESDDCVSRAELLKALDTWDKFGVDDTGHLFRLDNLSYPHYEPYIHYRDVIKAVKGMPSVQPKLDKGDKE